MYEVVEIFDQDGKVDHYGIAKDGKIVTEMGYLTSREAAEKHVDQLNKADND